MNRRGVIRRLGVTAALSGVVAVPAGAGGKRVAVVIGNSVYKRAGVARGTLHLTRCAGP